MAENPTELTPADLTAAPERRASSRTRLPEGVPVWLLHGPDFRRAKGVLFDLSHEGAGLVLTYRIHPGERLLLQLPGASPGSTVSQLARVVHATALPGGYWLIGCRTRARLTEADVRRILQG